MWQFLCMMHQVVFKSIGSYFRFFSPWRNARGVTPSTSCPLKLNDVASTCCRWPNFEENSLKTSKKHLTACSMAFSCHINTIIDWIDGHHVLECVATGEWVITMLPSNLYCTFDELILGLCTCIGQSAITILRSLWKIPLIFITGYLWYGGSKNNMVNDVGTMCDLLEHYNTDKQRNYFMIHSYLSSWTILLKEFTTIYLAVIH